MHSVTGEPLVGRSHVEPAAKVEIDRVLRLGGQLLVGVTVCHVGLESLVLSNPAVQPIPAVLEDEAPMLMSLARPDVPIAPEFPLAQHRPFVVSSDEENLFGVFDLAPGDAFVV